MWWLLTTTIKKEKNLLKTIAVYYNTSCSVCVVGGKIAVAIDNNRFFILFNDVAVSVDYDTGVAEEGHQEC